MEVNHERANTGPGNRTRDLGSAAAILYLPRNDTTALRRHRDPEAAPPGRRRLVARAPALAEALRPAQDVPAHVVVELGAELVARDARPLAGVEELLLEGAEEALGARVVRARPLARHRPRGARRVAEPPPRARAVAGAAVGVDDGPGALGLEREGGGERGVAELLVGVGGDRPGGRAAVPAVDHGAQVDPEPVQPDLGDVGDEQGAGAVSCPCGRAAPASCV